MSAFEGNEQLEPFQHLSLSHRLADFVSGRNISGKMLESSVTASSIAVESPTYGSDPASGKDAVATGALDIKKRRSIVRVSLCGSR